MDEFQPLFKHSFCFIGWSEKMLQQVFSMSFPAWAGGRAFTWAIHTWEWCRNGWKERKERMLSWYSLPLINPGTETGARCMGMEDSLPAFSCSAILLQLIKPRLAKIHWHCVSRVSLSALYTQRVCHLWAAHYCLTCLLQQCLCFKTQGFKDWWGNGGN